MNRQGDGSLQQDARRWALNTILHATATDSNNKLQNNRLHMRSTNPARNKSQARRMLSERCWTGMHAHHTPRLPAQALTRQSTLVLETCCQDLKSCGCQRAFLHRHPSPRGGTEHNLGIGHDRPQQRNHAYSGQQRLHTRFEIQCSREKCRLRRVRYKSPVPATRNESRNYFHE